MDAMPKDRQENEKAALLSIYGDQMTVNSSQSNPWTPLDCKLILRPQGSTKPRHTNEPTVELHIVCSAKYPEVIPQINLRNWKKISDVQISTLSDQLNALAERLQGEVMIFELAQHVETFLHQYSMPDYGSFYEQMVIRNKEQEEKEMKQKMASEKKIREEIKLQIQSKQQAVKKALRRKSVCKTSLSEPDEPEISSVNKYGKPSSPADVEKDVQESLITIESEEYTPWSISTKGQSRFENEFEHIQWLGKGAFGEVLKVRNKLDDGYYAIKRIELNAFKKQQNKKITREVKLLSRLNHENVVRYYNSWIEYATARAEQDYSKTTGKSEDKKLDIHKDLDKLALDMLPRINASVDWSDKEQENSSESSEGDWIDFRSESHERSELNCESTLYDSSDQTDSTTKSFLYLYIQMELCEKSTLRDAIDDYLCKDVERVWRLLREIIEGLCHIHQQGIIHRDLKPVNIFIGNDDHVKIGDFGLATSSIFQKATLSRESVLAPEQNEKSTLCLSVSQHVKDVSHTGQVGTTYYVAPELNSSIPRTTYNQKVDIFSLGIIFFEMCHPPFQTSMERFKILTELRTPKIIFPDEFLYSSSTNQHTLIRWMLNHDVKERPNSQELLQCDLIPTPELEEGEVKEMVRRTLSNPQSKDYKYLVESCFHQELQPALDATFNISSWRSGNFTFSLEFVSLKLKNIFQQHGAISFLPPLLIPAKGQIPETAVCLMTRLGGIVCATYDLRLSFSRYLIQNPHINQLKRYAIDKVYRERPAGIHPKEVYECAFDIVTPSLGNLMPEVEMISVIWEILNEFPSILTKNCALHLNHSNFITAMLESCGIDEVKQKSLCEEIFNAEMKSSSKLEYERFLRCLPLSEYAVGVLLNWVDVEGPINKVREQLCELAKHEHTFLSKCEIAFKQLESIIRYCEIIGLTIPISVQLRLVTNAQNYSGILCQVVCDQKTKSKRFENNVVMMGGRYDRLLTELKQCSPFEDKKSSQCVCGFTLSVDKLISVLNGLEKFSVVSILICSLGSTQITLDKMNLIKDLWRSGIKTLFINTMQTMEEVQAYCLEQNIPVIVFLKDTEPTYARVKTMTKDRFIEKKVPCNDLIEYLLKIVNKSHEASTPMKQDPKLTSSSDGLNITIISLEKINPSTKKRYECQITNGVSSALQKFSCKARVEVLGLSLENEAIKSLSCCIDLTTGHHDINSFLKRFPRYKKYLNKIMDHVEEIRRAHHLLALILFSLPDNIFKIVL